MKRNRRDASRIKQEQSASEDQSGHETLIQYEVVGVIAPNDTDCIDLSKKSSSIYLSIYFIED